MASVVENKKKIRKVLRSSFTRAANELEDLLNTGTCENESIQVTWELLNSKFDELRALDSEISGLLLESATEAELESDIDTCDVYVKKFSVLRIKYNKLWDSAPLESSRHSTVSATGTNASDIGGNTGMRKFKLPRIEFKHYDGSIKDWLSFWAQFKKVHEDNHIDTNDKIEYLRQATVPGSRARQLVESYPAMSENYEKIIESMRSRFGREDLQIEVYVRELLKLILKNSASKTQDIGTLYDRIETQLRALETLGITSDKCAAMLFPLIESCIPHDLLRVWQRSLTFSSSAGSEETSTSPLELRLKNLMSFLRHEVENEQRINLAVEGFGLTEGISSIEINSRKGGPNTKQLPKKPFECPTAAGLMNYNVVTCIFCAGSHNSDTCFKAQKLSLVQKRDVLSEKRACFRCLIIGHQSKKCRGRLRCVMCGRSHVVLMCPDLPSNKNANKPLENCLDAVSNDANKEQALTNQTSTHVFLQILRVTLKGVTGSKVVRALIDTGSQRSYILKETALQLGFVPKRRERIVHCLFGGTETPNTHNCYDITITNGNYSYKFEALDQQKICGNVNPIFNGLWTEEIRSLGIEISDNRQGGAIELLLGADVAGSLYTGGRQKLSCGLVAIETLLGWTLMGKMPTNSGRSDVVMTSLNLLVKDASITDLWDLEAIGIKEPSDSQTKEEMAMAAKELFLETVTVNLEGRYEVRLPWIEGHPPLPTNYKLAQKRLVSSLRKLENDGIFEQYDQIFREWEAEGIIEVMDMPEEAIMGNQGHYLPHRPVLKEDSATTKIRPVFDASAHEKGQPALNHCLEKGPNLIELILSMLLRFRENKIGVIADIRKAFLQISINENDRNFLRFLWVNARGQQIILRHRRVVFGLNSSPFLLGATIELHLSNCLRKCSETEASYSRDTVERLGRSFYVDNCVTSLPNEQSVEKFIRESVVIMSEGRFELRGWERSQNTDSDIVCDPCSVLGLNWHPQKDVLTINETINYHLLKNDLEETDLVVTKRKILSVTQKFFDPIGYMCPAILVPKLMLQSLWKNNLTWDQPVDDTTADAFRNWLRETTYFSKIEIPRWIRLGDNKAQDLSIHTFCDASQHAYASVVFLRVMCEEKVLVFLLAAKARVAPIKKSSSKMSIPRLELLATTIGARLYSHVTKNLEGEIESFFWSDSSTVISWLQRTDEWGVFVWNRVAEIKKLTQVERWRHIPGIQNPADLPSRGCSPKQLFNSRWWEGPKWLYGPRETWPSVNTTYNEEEINAERKKGLVTTLLNEETTIWDLTYFSKYHSTVRMIAWVFRFIQNCKVPNDKNKGELTAMEYTFAENFVLKLVQQQSFSGKTDERIKGLSPFYDENGIIRLNSRVSSREDTENYKFPVVLPSKHPVVNNLIMEMHMKSCHVGTQGLLSLLRERFWILGGRRTIRSVIVKCVTCKRYDSKPLALEPPPLPLDRVRDAVAFEVTGVDFAGPMYLKNGDKAWICLFTCAIFRAVHLELTTSLSTPSFLQALRRFVSRRGRPKTIYSDNGSNFVGAENALSALNWDTITRETSVQRICWRFNPPTASWWGGFWERLIGVLKRLLRKTLGRASVDYEDLLTLVCECEAVVNARPLTYLSEDPNDLIALSPAMFLRDQVECGLPDCNAVDNVSLCRKVRKIQTLRENLRVRFRTEYLGQLKLFFKGKSDRPIVVGELVLVGNDNSKRIDWPVGRVVEVLPGKDGRIRLVRVKTTKGQLLRPLQRLYPLECCSVPEFESITEGDKLERSTREEQNYCDEPVSQFNDSSSAEVSKGLKTRFGRVLKVPPRFTDYEM